MELHTEDSPIFISSLEMVKQIMRRVSRSPNIRVLGIVNEQFDRELGLTSGTDRNYPYITVMPADIEDDPTYNTFVLNSDGWCVKDNKGYRIKMRLAPIKVTLNVSFFTQDSKELIKFIEMWKFNYRKCSSTLTDKESGFEIDIKADLEPSLHFPNKDMESGNCYKLDGVLTLHTYAGLVVKQKLVEEIRVHELLAKGHSLDEIKNNNFELITSFTIKENINESDNSKF